jgi:hypothetical protein
VVGGAPATAKTVGDTSRQHWGIENSLHGVLNMTFGEDGERVRTDNAAENFATLRYAALNLLRNAPGKQKSIASRRRMCGWDRSYLLQVLAAPSPAVT